MSLKAIYYLTGLGAVTVSSAVGYSYLKTQKQGKNLIDAKSEIQTNDTLEKPGNLDVPKTHDSEKTVTADEDSDNPALTTDQKEKFSGYILFTTEQGNNVGKKYSKEIWDTPYYKVLLLDNQDHNAWQQKENSRNQESDEEDEEDEPESEKTNFAIPIETHEKEKAEKYLEELTKDIKSNKGSSSIYDKGALEKYLKSDKNVKTKFEDYFGKGIYEKVLEKLKTKSN